MVAKITDLAEVLPSGSRSERVRRQGQFDRIQDELDVMHRGFSIKRAILSQSCCLLRFERLITPPDTRGHG